MRRARLGSRVANAPENMSDLLTAEAVRNFSEIVSRLDAQGLRNVRRACVENNERPEFLEEIDAASRRLERRDASAFMRN